MNGGLYVSPSETVLPSTVSTSSAVHHHTPHHLHPSVANAAAAASAHHHHHSPNKASSTGTVTLEVVDSNQPQHTQNLGGSGQPLHIPAKRSVPHHGSWAYTSPVNESIFSPGGVMSPPLQSNGSGVNTTNAASESPNGLNNNSNSNSAAAGTSFNAIEDSPSSGIGSTGPYSASHFPERRSIDIKPSVASISTSASPPSSTSTSTTSASVSSTSSSTVSATAATTLSTTAALSFWNADYHKYTTSMSLAPHGTGPSGPPVTHGTTGLGPGVAAPHAVPTSVAECGFPPAWGNYPHGYAAGISEAAAVEQARAASAATSAGFPDYSRLQYPTEGIYAHPPAGESAKKYLYLKNEWMYVEVILVFSYWRLIVQSSSAMPTCQFGSVRFGCASKQPTIESFSSQSDGRTDERAGQSGRQ